MVMVFSTSAFGTYFKLTQSGSGNSSHVNLSASVSAEPMYAGVGLAWLAVGSVCLFIAGKEGPPRQARATIPVSPSVLHHWVPPDLTLSHRSHPRGLQL